jgi:hypothetical protein
MKRYPAQRIPAAFLAVVGALFTSGCFYSDAPLLTSSQYVQPMRAGLWENLKPMPDSEWASMSEQDRQNNDCRMESGQAVCGERVHLRPIADGSYQLDWKGEDTTDRAEFAALDADHFIVEQVLEDGRAEYALATKLSPDAFEIRLPDCVSDRYLHAYAPPAEAGARECRVADRQTLDRLFAEYQAKSSSEDAKLYRWIGE